MKSDPNPIQEFCLKSERNLRIAAAVGDAWSGAKIKLTTGFLDRLEARLRKKLKGWAFERDRSYFIDTYPDFYFYKPAWRAEFDQPQYYVNLQLRNYGQEMVFGLTRHYGLKLVKQRPHCVEALAAIRRNYPSAIPLNWWEACVKMQSPAADWRKPEVLWRMHKDDTFLQEVAAQLLDVARVSEHIVDRLARKK